MRPFPVMLFAAGFGTRMGALTQTQPKPLVKVGDKPLLDHALQIAEGAPRRVVNTHYKGEQIAQHLRGTDVLISHEAPDILETGGGLRAALPLLRGNPVFTLNTDAVWTGDNPLDELATGWNDVGMDALLLLGRREDALGFTGPADFVLQADGRIERAAGRPGLIYLGAQILRTDLLASIPDRVFSLNLLWDRMIADGRAFGIVHQGRWCDVGRPEGIAVAEAMMAADG